MKEKIYVKNYTEKAFNGKYSNFVTVTMAPKEIMSKFLDRFLKFYF